jgi:hypothetical protein
MYIKGKMRSVELFQEWEEGGIKKMVEGENSTMMYLMYCENFCKCRKVPQHNSKKLK